MANLAASTFRRLLQGARPITLAAIGVTLLVLGLNAVASFSATWTLIRNQKLVEQTQQVLSELEATMLTMADMETGLRGYLLTDRKSFLDPYTAGQLEIGLHLTRLETLVADNLKQRQRVVELKDAVDAKQREMKELLEIYKSEGLERSQQRARRGTERDLMNEIRKIIADMKYDEYVLLDERSKESAASALNAFVTIGIASVLSVCLVATVYYLMIRDAQRKLEIERRLIDAKNSLQDIVRERTGELTQTNMDLQSQIVERQRVEEQLRLFTAELERSNRELQEFAFVASHDLQEPLRKIQAFGDRLQQKYGNSLDDAGRDYIQRMQSAASRMNALIDDLLAFSRVTSKAQPFTPVDLGQIAAEVVTDLEARIQGTNGRVELGSLPVIDADPLQMRQLFQNLIGNGLKFHRPGTAPIVVVQAKVNATDSAAPVCVIEVRDNGIGFDEKYLDRIFVPFQRLHGRQEYEGTGMGLAVCRKIVERHGGSISARSTPEEGATFLVTLPATQQTA